MPDRFEDDRGVIQDLIDGPIDAMTEIFTRQGAIRGNHIHQQTTQYVYVVDGLMEFAHTEDDGVHIRRGTRGDLIVEQAGIPHAWRALLDTTVIVLTRGPRSGAAYESDTRRLKVPILT